MILGLLVVVWFAASAGAQPETPPPTAQDQYLRQAMEFLSSSDTNRLSRPPSYTEVRRRYIEGTEPADYAELRGDCVECHRRQQPNLVHQWEISPHAQKGVGCDSCHGKNHSQIFRENGRVSPYVCGKCHTAQGKEFAKSRHAHAEETLLKSALFAATPEASRASCEGCHRIGATHLDGGRGGCNFCHPGHTFSAADAREPEACTGCHTGEDYPQDIAYWTSKHGALYLRSRDAKVAPTCATCHHPNGYHGDDFGVSIGGGGTGGVLAGQSPSIPMREITSEAFSVKRSAMLAVCGACHSFRFAEASLKQADAVKAEGNALLAEAVTLIKALHQEGLIGGGKDFNLQLGGEQLPVDPTLPGGELLNRFYTMWRFHYVWAWKGAYHASHSVSNLQSRPGLKRDLEFIRANAIKLQNERTAP
jgi:hypothetical protein